MSSKVLLVEDDITLRNGIIMALQEKEQEFLQAGSIKEALNLWKKEEIGLILLDINLPDGSGYDFLKEIRMESQIPILVLTANDLETDEVMALKLGADDYLSKPFSLMVLRARIESLLRRAGLKQNNRYLTESLQLDFDCMKYYKNGKELFFSKTEERLLRLFIENKGNTMTRDFLIDRIWTDGGDFVDENALSVVINRLRNKLEDNPSKPVYIRTVYGLGYVWGKNA